MAQPEHTPWRKWSVVLVAVLCLTADQATKLWARNTLPLRQSEPFIPGILSFLLTSNTGAAFSLGAGNGILMTTLAAVMTVTLIVWTVRKQRRNATLMESIGMGFLIGGALGNLCDRFLRGSVTDFLNFLFMSFPVFNVADALIDCGLALLIISALKKPPTTSEQEAACEPRADLPAER